MQTRSIHSGERINIRLPAEAVVSGQIAVKLPTIKLHVFHAIR